MCRNLQQGQVCQLDQGSIHFAEILLAGILEFVDDRESICEDGHIWLGLG